MILTHNLKVAMHKCLQFIINYLYIGKGPIYSSISILPKKKAYVWKQCSPNQEIQQRLQLESNLQHFPKIITPTQIAQH